MALTFKTSFRVRLYELDSYGELPNSALARLFQETAMRATTNAGYPNNWFTEHKSVWVVHEMILEHLRPIHYPNELEISTWLSDMQRVRTHREYIARDAATQDIVARARSHWAHLSSETLAPLRIPTEIGDRFAPNGVRAIPRLEPRAYRMPSTPPKSFRTRRRALHYEADAMQHVNNTVYFDWIEETVAEAAAEWARENLGSASHARLCIRRHDIVYARAAFPGDDLEIDVQMVGAGQCASAWFVEVKRGNESLARDQITALWLDEYGKPARVRAG